MHAKKDFPIEVIRTLNSFRKKADGKLIKLVKKDHCLLRFEHTDPESDYFFNITKYEVQGAALLFTISLKPQSVLKAEQTTMIVTWNNVEAHLNSWTRMASEFSALDFWGEDPHVAQFAKEHFDDFELVDEHADELMEDAQLEWLDDYLEFVEKNIEQHANDKNSEDIAQIKYEVIHLRQEMTTKTRRENLKSLSLIWGRMKKSGFSLWKKFVPEFAKGVAKKLADVVVDYAFKKMTGQLPE